MLMLAHTDDFPHPHAVIAPDGTIEGYASLFGELDQARDMVMPGAFEASLRTRPVRRVPMLFQHDPSEPIGVWLDLREDYRGLYARGRLIPEVVRARELLALLKAGTADGLSIGFRTVNGRLDPKTRVRKLYAIDLWEISIVMFPLLSAARVRAVKEATTSSLQGRTYVPARCVTRHAWPVDASARHLRPDRLFRRHPRFRFQRGERGLSWRDLTLPERALRAAGSSKGF
jgi:HK97 family phage prohead protease